MSDIASTPQTPDLRHLVEHASDIIYRVRLQPSYAVEYISPAVTRLIGYTPEEHYADPDLSVRLTHSDDRRLLAQGSLAYPDGEPLVIRVFRRDGRMIWLEQRNVRVYGATGQVVALEGFARDVSEQVQARANLERYRILSEHAREMVLFVDPESGRIIEANRAACEAYGYTHDELLERTISDLRAPHTLDQISNQIQRSLSGGYLFETIHCRADGSTFPVEVSSTATKVEDRTTLVSIIRDISARQSADAERDLLWTALSAAATAVVITDIEGLVQWANPAFTTLTGYAVQEVLGHKTSVLRSGHHDTGFYQEMWNSVLAGQVWRGELVNRRKNGELYVEEMTITPVLHGERVTHFVAVKQEITQRVERERERSALLAIAEATRAARSRTELVPTLLAQARVLVGADSVALAIRDPATGDTVFEPGLGSWAEISHVRLPAGASVTGHVISTGTLYHNDEVQTDPRFAIPNLMEGVRAAVCAPLRANHNVIGALWAGRQAPFGEAEVRLVAAIADLAAGTLERVTLAEQTERRLARLAALGAIDHAIASSFDIRLSLGVVLDHMLQQLGVDAANVLVLNYQSLTLEHAASRGFRTDSITASHVRLGEGLAGQAALERQRLMTNQLHTSDSGFLRQNLIVSEGFTDYLVTPLIARGQVRGVLELYQRRPLTPEAEWFDFLETLSGQAAMAIDNAELFERMQRANLNMALAYDTTLEGWSRALELRDKETDGHSQRVTELSVRLARAMGLDEEEIVHLRRGALLHDIGKMGIPDAILLKPGPLTLAEREVIKQHPVYAYNLLRPIAYLRPALDIPYCHHEKWDGTGYPRGLRGDEIPLAARIFAVVDVYDAVTSNRPYQRAWPIERARTMIAEEAGHHFDPEVVATFLQLIAD
ncbi:MAG: PAS domain S-box protein [Oscillochloridaceae bacterium umkhey_bin13]